MRNRFVIIDDFYTDPIGLVKHALNTKLSHKGQGNYAGQMTTQSFLSEHHRSLFEQLTLEKPINSATDGNGRIRFSLPTDSFKQDIHFDGVGVNWSGVIYLSQHHPEVDGTIFWQHRKTGLEEIPHDLDELGKHGLGSQQAIESLLKVDGVDKSKWRKMFAIPYRFNRLVLFRPWLFHSPGPAFGTDLWSSRIVQTLFLSS